MRPSLLRVTASAVTLSLLLAGAAAADDWVAVKLRGSVLQQVNGQWEKLEKGGVVPDDRMIRTTNNGRVTLTRGNETLDLSPNTMIQIIDKVGPRPFTNVRDYRGTVSVEAEVRQVQHFAVQTPYLAAVVKGTRFTVSAKASGSEVEVERGHVAVEDSSSHLSTTISAGQAAATGKGQELEVSGSGELPVIVDQTGKPVSEPVAAAEPAVPTSAAAPSKPQAPEKLKNEPGKGPNGPKDSGGKGPKGDDSKGGPKSDSGKGPGGPKGDTSNGPGGPKSDSGKGPGGGSKGDSGSGPKGDSGKGPGGGSNSGPGGGGKGSSGGGDHGGGDHGGGGDKGGGGGGKGKK